MKINILGTDYEIEFLQEKDECMEYGGLVGYTDFSVKSIKVLKQKRSDPTDSEDLRVFENNVIRHEVIHAFLYESGIDIGTQFHNEECVDFFAMQIPKLQKIFDRIGGML